MNIATGAKHMRRRSPGAACRVIQRGLRRCAEAAETYGQAMRLNPNDADARAGYERASR